MTRFEYLLEGYVSGSLLTDELQEFFKLAPENESFVGDRLLADLNNRNFDGLTTEGKRDAIFKSILDNQNRHKPRATLRSFRKWMAAASIILSIGIGGYIWYASQKTGNIIPAVTKQEDIPPGKSGAILTFTDGTKIVLDDTKNGQLSQQNGIAITKTDGQVEYNQTGKQPQIKVAFHTLSTPNGRQFALVLSDGSKVWLNAASSITFPTSFIGNERKVQITGEAYFEVAHNPAKPFYVSVNNMQVQVLGTHFNINAYVDEAMIKTTLLEGSVKVSVITNGNDQQATVLKPGQQANVTDNNIRLLRNIDVDAVVAWKNGYFSFKDANLETILKEASRWYDVQVHFAGIPPDMQFSGEIGRSLTLQQFLTILGETRIRYKIEGRKLSILQ